MGKSKIEEAQDFNLLAMINGVMAERMSTVLYISNSKKKKTMAMTKEAMVVRYKGPDSIFNAHIRVTTDERSVQVPNVRAVSGVT